MKTLLSVILLLFTSNIVLSQTNNDFAILEKNINERAKGLSHHLNATKDTLVLSSDRLISKVYSVNEDQKREVDRTFNLYDVEIPLTNFSKGKHIFVTVQGKRRIVFVVKIFGDDHMLIASSEKKPAVLKKRDD